MTNIDLTYLREKMPEMAAKLATMMADEALLTLLDTGLSLDDAQPSVSITYTPKDGGESFRVTLSVGPDVPDEDDDDY